jgi:hypothetical protein
MSNQIIVQNHGPLIRSTNYWDLPLEEAGKLFVSCNAGAVRILVPRAFRRIIDEMRSGCRYHVVISRGPWTSKNLKEAVEILFEDGTDGPFCLHLSPESFDSLPGEPEPGRDWVVSVWDLKKGRPHKALERPAHWRRVPEIPWLKPWGG